MREPTFTAIGGDLSKRVVTAVTLAPNDAWLARTLAILRVADSGQGACGVAVAQEADGAARGPVVVLLGGRRRSHRLRLPFLDARGSFQLRPLWKEAP